MTHIPISRKQDSKTFHTTDIRTQIRRKDRIDFKNSVTYFNRNIGVPTYTFEGTQVSTFSELTYTRTNQKQNGWLVSTYGQTNLMKRNLLIFS